MNISNVLDVIIGLVFVYFLMALIASGIQEVIAGLFTWRGTYLAKAIDVILDNSARAGFAWASVRDALTAHLTTRPGQSAADRQRLKVEELTKHLEQGPPLPPPQLAEARQELDKQQVLLNVLNVHSHPLIRGVPTDLPSYIPARNFALALLEALRDGSQAPLFTQAERTIAALPKGDLQRTLSLFLQDAAGDLDTFRAHVERWFDDAMDRVSGIYSRLSQYVLLGIGLVLTLVLNVDSLQLARTLWQTPDLRAAIVTQAQMAAAQSQPAAPATQPAPTSPGTAVNAPDGHDNARATAALPPPGPAADVAGGLHLASANLGQLQTLQIPIGWHLDGTGPAIDWRLAIPGWLMTACAVGLGAPFWFSLLLNLTNFRNAGPKPKRADDPAVVPAP